MFQIIILSSQGLKNAKYSLIKLAYMIGKRWVDKSWWVWHVDEFSKSTLQEIIIYIRT